ncbi:MAG: HAD family hydrolase [Bryobacteraceae bacterium]|nr:HAD family hydrolase [Bryobacteraceae bacterium]
MNNSPSQRRRYVLLDRDGTLIVHRPYLGRVDQVELVPGVVEGLQNLSQLGFGLAVLTNQSGIGRGYFTAEDVDRIHAKIREELAAAGVVIDGFYCCPHVPEDHCTCRKPEPGLALQAAGELGFELAESFLIGDNDCDIHLGARIRATTFLVKNASSVALPESAVLDPDYVVGDLGEAARVIADRVSAEGI